MLFAAFFLTLFLSVAASYSPSPTGGGSSTSATSAIIRRVVVVGGTHGNEYTGVWCIKALDAQREAVERKYPSLRISTLLANPEAHLQNKRFVHTDLNREFSKEKLFDSEVGSEGVINTIETLRAREVNEILGPKFAEDGRYGTDIIVDLHSTTSNMGITIIIPEGDAVMAEAAAYVMWKCSSDIDVESPTGNEKTPVRCLMHRQPDRQHRPNLSSAGKHGFTIEVGPVPQGVLRHDAVEKTTLALDALLEFLEQRNQQQDATSGTSTTRLAIQSALLQRYRKGLVPCFQSAPAVREGEMSGKIPWPSDPDNPNFPAYMIHKSLQDRDFHLVRTGDPLFVTLNGDIVPYNGSHGQQVYLIFVNEGGYYYPSSGTGIGVAVASHFSLETGRIVGKQQRQEHEAAATGRREL